MYLSLNVLLPTTDPKCRCPSVVIVILLPWSTCFALSWYCSFAIMCDFEAFIAFNYLLYPGYITLQKKWSFPLRIFQQIWPNPQKSGDLVHLLKKSLMENLIFCTVSSTKLNQLIHLQPSVSSFEPLHSSQLKFQPQCCLPALSPIAFSHANTFPSSYSPAVINQLSPHLLLNLYLMINLYLINHRKCFTQSYLFLNNLCTLLKNYKHRLLSYLTCLEGHYLWLY